MPERDNEVYGLSEADVDDLYANVLGPRERYFSQGRVRQAAPRQEVFAFQLTGNMSGGTADATILQLDLTAYKTGETVQDDMGFFGWMTTGQQGHCVRYKDVYHVIGPYVTHVQWDDPDLEYSRDGGTNWTNIDTAEDCDA